MGLNDSSKKYAIVNIYGRQFKVAEGDSIKASYVSSEVGTTLSFPEVLLVNAQGSVKVGAPLVAGAKVTATVASHGRHDKVIVFKYLRKNKHKKMHGHRQPFTTLTISSIEG